MLCQGAPLATPQVPCYQLPLQAWSQFVPFYAASYTAVTYGYVDCRQCRSPPPKVHTPKAIPQNPLCN